MEQQVKRISSFMFLSFTRYLGGQEKDLTAQIKESFIRDVQQILFKWLNHCIQQQTINWRNFQRRLT